jgi:hypothetical protein
MASGPIISREEGLLDRREYLRAEGWGSLSDEYSLKLKCQGGGKTIIPPMSRLIRSRQSDPIERLEV